MVHLTACSFHVTCRFQREITFYNCLNIKELLARNRYNIWSLSDCNRTRTHDHLVRKRTVTHLEKLPVCDTIRTYSQMQHKGQYLDWKVPHLPFLEGISPSDSSPTGTSQMDIFLNGQFPDWKFPRRRLPRPDISPLRRFPNWRFPQSNISLTICFNKTF